MIVRYLKENKLELIVTFCILSNLFPFFMPKILYYIGLALLGYKMVKWGLSRIRIRTCLFCSFC